MSVPRFFGTNGIRGIAGQEINATFAYQVGSSVAVLFPKGRVAVGMDGRLSSQMLRESLVAGILAQGRNVEDHGLIPTPALEFLVKDMQADGGVMITASHNPPEYNGFKIIDSDGIELSRKKEKKIEQLIHRNSWRLPKQPGRRTTPEGTLQRYFASLKGHLDEPTTSLKKFKVVVDAGNGVSVLTTPRLLKDLGCEVLTLNDNIDGRFPGRPSEPRPDTLSTLSRVVKEERAHLGVGHDGDGDRAIFVDETGVVQWGDRTLALIEDELLRERPGSKLVTPLNASMALAEIARKRHGRLVLTRVGSIEVSRTMIKTGALLGGEENGGIFYKPHHPVRDGAMATLLVLKAMTRNKLPLSRLLARLPKFPMAKEKFSVKDEAGKSRAMRRLQVKLKRRVTSQLDGLKVNLASKGWVLIRPSGTEPFIRLYAEGRTEKDLASVLDEFRPLVFSAVS